MSSRVHFILKQRSEHANAVSPLNDSAPDDGWQEDGEILTRLQRGDSDALGELMNTYWRPLTGYVARMLGSSDAAEDVVQEVFVRLWQNRARLNSSGSTRSLVYKIARNIVFKLIRHQAVRSRKAFDLRHFFARSTKNPLDQVVDNELRASLELAIGELPPRRRDAFVLLRTEGLSLKETAEVMGVSTQTVANHAALAMKQLRLILQSHRTT